MPFRTKLDYSNNRQIKQFEKTQTVLSGGTSFGLPFSALTSGPNLLDVEETNVLSTLASTFSGNNTTTNYNWFDPAMSLGEPFFSAITPSNSADTQTVELVFAPETSTVIDGNTVNLSYTGVSFDITPIAFFDLGGGAYSGTVETDELVFYSATSLDFTGRTIWVDVSGITRTDELIITKNPVIGRVFTCIDSEGKGAWLPSTGSGSTQDTFVTGGTYSSGTAVFTNNTGGTFSVTGFSTGTTFTGGTVSGETIFTNGLTANTISATTYQNLPLASVATSGSTLYSTSPSTSNFNTSSSIFFGPNAGSGATNATSSNFFGPNAGNAATDAAYSNFLGINAGEGATDAAYSNFIGGGAGRGATFATSSNFLGPNAGNGATNASASNFLGFQAGIDATNANNSNFLGSEAGSNATNANDSNFFGFQAGFSATSANNSNFFGFQAGRGATSASFSNFLGFQAGSGSTGSNNIIIGTNISLTGSNSINIGGVLFGINTHNITTGSPSFSAQTTGRIGIGVTLPEETLDVVGNGRFRTIGSGASAGALHYTVDGVLTTNTSDIRLKTNINTIENALDLIGKLRGVYYKWKDGSDNRIGFIAQEVYEVVPELAFVNEKTEEKLMGVHYDNVTALLVEGVKELSKNKLLEYTPVNSEDQFGEIGQTVYDDNYIYVKTNSGWKRSKIETF
jgi:hypothetical protein